MVKEGEEVEGGRVRGVQPEAMMALECVSEMYVYTCIHTHANTRIHIHAYTYTHTYTHTHTHTHLVVFETAAVSKRDRFAQRVHLRNFGPEFNLDAV